ncbi:MAG: hypothetical protein ACRDL8_15005, partial [Solirubrobacteraceae bacterium]
MLEADPAFRLDLAEQPPIGDHHPGLLPITPTRRGSKRSIVCTPTVAGPVDRVIEHDPANADVAVVAGAEVRVWGRG